MINHKINSGDRVEFTRNTYCGSGDGSKALRGHCGTLECHHGFWHRVRLASGGNIYVHNDGIYDTTGCLKKIPMAKELTISQISEKLGYEVKVVK